MLNKMPYSSAMLVMKNYTPSGEAAALAAQYPAPPFLYAQALSGAINLMAVMPDGAHIAEHYRTFLAHGLAVARGDKQ